MHQLLVNNDKKYAEGIIYYEEACREGSIYACNDLGFLYGLGKVIEQNYTKARKYYEIACENNLYMSCNNLGVIYEFGRDVEVNYFEAKKYYEISCNNKTGIACSNLGRLQEKGLGTRQDYDNAMINYIKACEYDKQFCNNLGLMYYNGVLFQKDLKKAKELFGLACDNGDQKGCDNYKL